MSRRARLTALAATLLLFASVLGARVTVTATSAAAQAKDPDAWQIPANAAEEKNPVDATPELLRKGLQIYGANCERCHGENGKGDGPDADPDRPPEDLGDSGRAQHNPDGVMFYKIWEGRKKPKMPAFKTELSKTEVWTVIHYVNTFRQ